MTLLSPGFLLAGVLLAGVPILIHLLNRRRYKEQPWAAMEFLLRAMKKNRKRLRFEQWLLLAVRCMLLGLLGLALARPGGCDGGAAAGLTRQTGLHVIVIDDSYSMQYQADRAGSAGGGGAATHLEQARLLALRLIDRMQPGSDAVAVVSAGTPARVLLQPGYDLDAARAAVNRVLPTAATTDLAGALRLATTIANDGLAGDRPPLRELNLLTDGTRSSLGSGEAVGVAPGGLASAVRAAGKDAEAAFTRVTFHHLGLANQTHTAVLDVSPGSALVTARQAQELRATARSFGSAGGGGAGGETRAVQWRLDDQVLPGGGDVRIGDGSDPLTVSQVKFGRAGPRVLTVSLAGNDRLPVDTVRRRVVDVAERVKVLVVEGERGGTGGGSGLESSGAFLRLALAPPASASEGGAGGAGGNGTGAVAGRTNSALEPEVISDLELGGRALNDYRVVMLAGVPQVAEGTAEQLRTYVRGGGVLVVFVGEGVSADSYNATMLPRGLTPGPLVKLMTSSGDAGGGFTFDFNPQGNLHPMLKVFEREPKTGLDTVRTFTYWQVQWPAVGGGATAERVLDFNSAGSKDGVKDPAITLQTVGRGRVVFVSTSAGADGWTTLPARPVFVSLVQEMVGTSLTARDGWMNVTVGRRLELPPSLTLAGVPELADAAGRTYALTSEAVEGEGSVWRSEPLTTPGVYVLKGVAEAGGSDGAKGSVPVVVNVDAVAEADVRTVEESAVAPALGDIAVEVVRDQLPPERSAEAARGADFGWIVMVAVLGFVGLESVMAMRFGHHGR